jgi:predicted nucleic acid-binding protein
MLDTSTVILLGRIEDSANLLEEAVISAITLAELSVGPHVAHSDDERAARQAHLPRLQGRPLAAHARYSRVHNPVTGEQLLVDLPLCKTSV